MVASCAKAQAANAALQLAPGRIVVFRWSKTTTQSGTGEVPQRVHAGREHDGEDIDFQLNDPREEREGQGKAGMDPMWAEDKYARPGQARSSNGNPQSSHIWSW